MTRENSAVKSPKKRSAVKHRNFLNSISARRLQILKEKQIKWCFDFETETAIDLKQEDRAMTSISQNLQVSKD